MNAFGDAKFGYRDSVYVSMDGYCAGQIQDDQGKIAYFYCKWLYFGLVQIIFSEKWLDLYELIENKALKIQCYSFLFE